MESDKEVGMDFQDLPAVLKLRIFSHLTFAFLNTTVARVCKDWWELSKDPSLWKDVKVCANRVDSWEELRETVSQCSMLRNLTIYVDSTHARDVQYQVPALSSPTLKELSIKDACVNPDFWTELDERFPRLEALQVWDCRLDVGGEDFSKRICALSNISRLQIKEWNSKFILRFDFKAMGKAFTKLETLHLYYRYKVTIESSVHDVIRERCETLKDVILDNCFFTDDLVTCFSLCSGLVSLDLNYFLWNSDETIDALVNLDLITLKLNCINCDFIDAVSSEAFCRFFRSSHRRALKELLLIGFENFTDEVLEVIGQTCTNLTDIIFYSIEFVTNEGLFGCLSKLPNLSHLSLDDCFSSAGESLAAISPSVKIKYCDTGDGYV